MLTPFSFQSYVGIAPPFVVAGVNVMFVPAQVGLADAVIETVGVAFVTTVMVSEFEVAVVGDAQVAFEVSTQVITSLFTNVEEEYVLLVAPAIFTLFFFH